MKPTSRLLLIYLFIASVPVQAQLEGPGSGLVAWWKFDEASGDRIFDSSATADHTGLLIGSPTRLAGKSGGTLQFNGITDLVRIPQSPTLFLGTKTITMWARLDDFLRLYSAFYGWGRGPLARDNYHGYSRYDGSVYATYLNGAGTEIIRGNTIIAPAGTVKLGQWAHFAFVYKGDATSIMLSLYKNGVLAGTPYTSTNGLSSNSAMTAIGSQEDLPNPSYIRVFSGAMDDYRVYNRALSSNEIAELYAELYTPSGDKAAPTVPANLTAAAASHWQIDLNWNASTDNVAVAGYIIYRNGSPIASVRDRTSYSDTEHTPSSIFAYTLKPATSYTYTVVAYDDAYNVSSPSTPASAALSADPGGPMYTLTVTRYGGPLSTIVSKPDGINCGTVCSYSFTNGTSVVLMPYSFISGMSATPPPFAGWAGGLSGNGAGFLRMTSDISVSAYYSTNSLRPEIKNFQIANGKCMAAFSGILGSTYVLEQSTNLTAGWSDLQTIGPVSNAAPVTVEDTITTLEKRFYRLRLEP